MEVNYSLRKKISQIVGDEKIVSDLEYLLVTEIESRMFEIASLFDNYFFAISTCFKNECKVKYSKSISNVIGYGAAQIEKLPKRLSSIIHEDDRLRVENGLSDFFSGTSDVRFEIDYRVINSKDEITCLTETIFAERDKTGEVVKYYSLFRDISKIEKEKSDIISGQIETEKMNSVKDKFISIVSHDLKAPYTTLLGFSEILLNDATLPEEERQEYLEYIHSSSQHQLNLIEHLLDWSRLRTGRTLIEEQRLNLKNIINASISQLTGEAVRKSINISANVQKDIFIKSDEKQIIKALNNLLTNSIHFSDKGSSVIVYGNRFKNGMIEIIVKDNGVGIPESDQEKLFKLDEKVSTEGTSGELGNGMGLIVVKEIMTKLKGDVWFYSKVGEGSEFHLTIPEAKNIILLIDEDEFLLEERGKYLSESFTSFSVITAPNGYKALDLIEEELPSVIVTKENLTLLSGIELLKRVRNKDKYFSASIIILADEINEEVENKFEPLVVEGVFESDIPKEKLVKIIRRSLQ